MPDIYDIAAAMDGHRIGEQYIQGVKDRTEIDSVRTNTKAQQVQTRGMEANIEEDAANRPTRDAQSAAALEQAKAAQLTAKNQQAAGEIDFVYQTIGKATDETTFQIAQAELKKRYPNNEQYEGTFAENEDEIRQLTEKLGPMTEFTRQLEATRKRVQDPNNPNLEADRKLLTAMEQKFDFDINSMILDEEIKRAQIESERRRFTGTSGGRGTGKERAGQAISFLSSKWSADPQSLSDEERVQAMSSLEIAYPAKPMTRKLVDGSFITVINRNIPNDISDFAKDILGDSFGSEVQRGKGLETVKQREEREQVTRGLSLVEPIVEKLEKKIEQMPSYGFGAAGEVAKGGMAVKEWFTGEESPYSVLKADIDSYVTQLDTVSKPLIDKGVFSKDDWKKVEALRGDSFWGTKSSVQTALERLKEFKELIIQGYDQYKEPEGEPQEVSFEDYKE